MNYLKLEHREALHFLQNIKKQTVVLSSSSSQYPIFAINFPQKNFSILHPMHICSHVQSFIIYIQFTSYECMHASFSRTQTGMPLYME